MNPRRQNLKNMTYEEIENAMKRYLDNGGTIKHLDTPYDNPNLNYDSMDH